MTTDATKTSIQEMEEVITCEAKINVGEDVQEVSLEAVGTSEMISMAVEAAPSLASPNRSTPAEKTRRGPQGRTAEKSQKSQGHQVDLDSASAEETSTDSVKSVPSVRGRRGKSAVELLEEVPVPSPARKSTRGRIIKEQAEAQTSSHASSEDEKVALKPRRGRKAEVLQVGPVTDLKTPARVKRGRKEKHESGNPQESEAIPGASVVEVGVAPESAELQPSAETEAPAKSGTKVRRGRARKEPTTVAKDEEPECVKSPDAAVEVKTVALEISKIESAAENEDSLKPATKPRRGRLTKKEMLKTLQVEESSDSLDAKSSDNGVESKSPESTEVRPAVEPEDPVKPNSKPRRGRTTKKESPETTQAEETSKPSSDSEVLPEEHSQIPVVKSRRGRRANPVALNKQAVVDESNAVESQPKPEAPAVRSNRGARNKQLKIHVEDTADGPTATAAAAEEPAEEPVVKNVRGGRRTKQPKAQVLDDSQEEAQDKPSIDSESIQQSEAPAARSARGKRTAAVKGKPEAAVKRGRRAAAVEVPPPVVRPGRGRKAAAKSEPEVAEETTTVVEPVEEPGKEIKAPGSVTEETPLSEGVGVSSEVVPKRGRIAKKAKVSTENTAVSEAEQEAAEKEPQLKSKEKEEPAGGDDSETKKSAKGRKARATQKQEEPEKEKPVVEENVQPARRGRAAAAVVSRHDEVATCPKRGQKRKDMEENADAESLPKRRRGKAVGAEAQPDKRVAKEAEETLEAEAEEPPKKEEKPARGRRKATREDVPSAAEDPASGPFPPRPLRRSGRTQQPASFLLNRRSVLVSFLQKRPLGEEPEGRREPSRTSRQLP